MYQRLSDRQHRIIEILTGKSRPVSIPEVAKQLECSERTVHRDIEAMREVAINITTIPGRTGGLELSTPGNVPHGSETATSTIPAREGSYIGRNSETAIADDALQSALDGRGQIIMVLGEPGIGKTRFARELRTRSRQLGFTTAWGRCRDIEGAPPYWPWIQAVRELFATRGDLPSVDLPQENANVITAAMPELAGLFTDQGSEIKEPQESSQFLLYDSFSRLLKMIAAERSVLVILDDLHWADQASLGLFEFVSNEIEDSPIMVVGTSRTVDPVVTGRVASTLSDLSRNPVFSRVELTGLTRDQVGQLVELESAGGVQEALTDEIFAATEGNPFFTIEMSRLYADSSSNEHNGTELKNLPDAVRDVVERRLNTLSQECVSLLRVGAVLGYQFDYKGLVSVGGPAITDTALDVLDEAQATHVLRRVAGRHLAFEFGHPLIHRVLYDTTPTRQRIQMHARVAEELERSSGNRSSIPAAELAVHFNEARTLVGNEKVVKYATLAGRQAMSAYASYEAIDQFKMALAAKDGVEDIEAADIGFELGNALNKGGGKPTEAIEALVAAFDIYEANDRIDRATEVASVGIIRAYGRSSVRQAELCQRALKLIDPNSLDTARILIEYSAALGALDGTERSLAALNRANEIARREEDLFVEAKSLACMGALFLGVGEYSNSVDVVLQAQKIIPKIEDPQFLVGLCLRTASAALTALGEFEEAKRQLAQLIKHNLSLPGFAFTHVDFQLSSVIALVEGDWDEARRFAELRLSDKPSAEKFGLEEQIGYMTGTSETPISDLSQFITDSSQFDLEEIGWNAPMLAFAGLVLGDVEAIGVAESAVTAEPEDPNHNVHPIVVDAVRAIGAIAREDKNLAAELYLNFLPFRQTWSPALRIFGIDRLLALTAITAEDPEMAQRHFEESIAFCENAGMRPELAWTYHDYVIFLLSKGGRVDRSNLLQMLESGLAITTKLGMAPLEQNLLVLIDKVVNASAIPVYPDGLTRREVEVLRLIAAGKSNREIAEELVITENTGTKHVANVFVKTASSNRVEAANYARTQGLLKS